jgi:hypothetical protein
MDKEVKKAAEQTVPKVEHTAHSSLFIHSCHACSEHTDQEADEAMAKEIEKAAEQVVSEFEQGMQEVMENLEKAQMAFDDLSGGVWVY